MSTVLVYACVNICIYVYIRMHMWIHVLYKQKYICTHSDIHTYITYNQYKLNYITIHEFHHVTMQCITIHSITRHYNMNHYIYTHYVSLACTSRYLLVVIGTPEALGSFVGTKAQNPQHRRDPIGQHRCWHVGTRIPRGLQSSKCTGAPLIDLNLWKSQPWLIPCISSRHHFPKIGRESNLADQTLFGKLTIYKQLTYGIEIGDC